MSREKKVFKESDVQFYIGSLLRWGVILAMSVVFIGGIIYVYRHGQEKPAYHTFNGEPGFLKTISGILQGVAAIKGRAIIQLGILLLIATPIARILLSIVSFVLEKDYLYVVITLIVFGIILFSMLSGIGG
ncbi:DUF1634 domain-containing protein [Mucilaginibacter arboris]|uniref:DUF1634 domain-containing protein n=1 Tax=Mucilaginibacter arboris TaxID=2682090 RepID=A0A7K1STV7_9SPHI|nr:DUF1634 domain-containing protein [Mucilaginibacter arboris]MVN20762.1 DUF1634 domain-containing protein [Mucilaginibacter arboris]